CPTYEAFPMTPPGALRTRAALDRRDDEARAVRSWPLHDPIGESRDQATSGVRDRRSVYPTELRGANARWPRSRAAAVSGEARSGTLRVSPVPSECPSTLVLHL